MSTYDTALESAKLRAQRTNATYFIYHQPEAWEDRETGWHFINETDYINDACDIDEQTVRCSVTWDDETGEFSIENFHPWQFSRWHDG